MLNICSAKFDFISGCVSAFICSVYRVLKDLANVVIGTVITFKFVNTCGCVFFMYGVVCGFVCEDRQALKMMPMASKSFC